MRRSKTVTLKILIWSLIFLYVCAIGMGLLLIRYSHFDAHRKRYLTICSSYAEVYRQVRHVGGVDHVGVGLVFNTDGEIIYTFGKKSFYAMRSDIVSSYAQNYVSDVIKEEKLFKLVWFAPNKTEAGFTSLIYSMVPIEEDGHIIGIMCYVFETQNFVEISVGYAILITIFFALIIMLTASYNKSIMKYDLAQQRYLDNVTHEMKTPVASIRALAEALSDNMDQNDEDRAIYCGMILREADQQSRMIANILELSKIQSGFDDHPPLKIMSADIFKSVCEKYADRCRLMDITFEVTDDVLNMPPLWTNAGYIRQLLDILLSNAIKFTDGENGHIRISAAIERRRVVICIEDNGVGIAKEDLPHICERFFRSKNAGSFSGSGIGLAIANEIVTRLRERLWFESETGEGTRAFFTVRRR